MSKRSGQERQQQVGLTFSRCAHRVGRLNDLGPNGATTAGAAAVKTGA